MTLDELTGQEDHYYRAIVLKINPTNSKRTKIKYLIEVYRKVVNKYLQVFFSDKTKKYGLNRKTFDLVSHTEITSRYKWSALKQALGIYDGCKKTAKKTPVFSGFPNLDAKFLSIEENKNSTKFDLVFRLSPLDVTKGKQNKRIVLPTKKTKVLNYWLEKGELIQGGELHEDKIIVFVKVSKPKQIPQTPDKTKTIGVDLGKNKCIVVADNPDPHLANITYIGEDLEKYIKQIENTKTGSKGRKRALKSRDNYIDQQVNKLDLTDVRILFYEDLTGLNKKTSCSRLRHWCYARCIQRIIERCQENSVYSVYVDPRNTSRTCPNCSSVDEGNRKLEDFCCLTCGYKHDADAVGAINVLCKGLRFVGSLESPILEKV